MNFWQVTEPSIGYQVKFIHLISKFVEEKGFDPSDPTAIQKVSRLQKIVSVKVAGPELQIDSPEKIQEIRLFDLKDRELLRHSVNGNSVRVALPSLPSGIYFAKIKTVRADVVKRVAVK